MKEQPSHLSGAAGKTDRLQQALISLAIILGIFGVTKLAYRVAPRLLPPAPAPLLGKPLGPIDPAPSSLNFAVFKLQKASGIPIGVRWEELHEEGITGLDPGPVVSGRTLGEGLKSLLKGREDRVQHIVYADFILLRGRWPKYVTRFYDVQDIIVPIVQQWRMRGITGDHRTGALIGPASPPASLMAASDERRAAEEICSSLMAFTGKNDWHTRFNEGDADIKAFGGLLIVRQTEEKHRAILELLARIRQAVQSRPSESAPRHDG